MFLRHHEGCPEICSLNFEDPNARARTNRYLCGTYIRQTAQLRRQPKSVSQRKQVFIADPLCQGHNRRGCSACGRAETGFPASDAVLNHTLAACCLHPRRLALITALAAPSIRPALAIATFARKAAGPAT